MPKITRLTDAERVDVLPLAMPFIQREYNWSHATPELTRCAIDLYVNERPALRRDVLRARRADRKRHQSPHP